MSYIPLPGTEYTLPLADDLDPQFNWTVIASCEITPVDSTQRVALLLLFRKESPYFIVTEAWYDGFGWSTPQGVPFQRFNNVVPATEFYAQEGADF